MRAWRDVANPQDKRPLLGLGWLKSQPNGAVGLICLPTTDGEKVAGVVLLKGHPHQLCQVMWQGW